jgi:ADP-heptose:LPS heptosyltransferase
METPAVYNKILIVQTAYIGDVILATSLIAEVSRSFPNATIDFALRKGNESIIGPLKQIRKTYIWDKNQSKYKSLFSIIKEVRAQKYDVVINIQRFFNAGLLTALSGAKVKIGFTQNPLSFLFNNKIEHKIPYILDDGTHIHEVQRNFLLLEPILADFKMKKAAELSLTMDFTPSDEVKIKGITSAHSKYIVLAPSSVWFTKQMPKEKWIELIKSLKKDYAVFLIGAPTDKEFLASLYIEDFNGKDNIVNLAGILSLRESAVLMREADRVFVNDSAPLHLASAVDAKTTSIFCSTHPNFGYTGLSKDHILVQASKILSCRPCGLHGKKECPLIHFDCGFDIRIKDLLDTI